MNWKNQLYCLNLYFINLNLYSNFAKMKKNQEYYQRFQKIDYYLNLNMVIVIIIEIIIITTTKVTIKKHRVN